MAVKFLPNLLRRRGSQDSAVAHAISGSVAVTSGLHGSVFSSFGGGWDVQKAVADALEKVIWVFRCVDAIATNQAKLTMVTRVGHPVEGKIVKDTVVDRLLNHRANIYENSADFRYRLSAQLLLSKRGAFLEVPTNGVGVPQSIHLLPPHLVEPIPDPETFVSGYRLLNQVAHEEVILPPKKVIWIKLKPHPTDPYRQMTPLVAAGLAIETDWLARLFNRQFLLNDGRPGLLVAIMGRLSKPDAEEIKARLSGGPMGAGRTTVIEADDINVADLGATPRDMQWLDAIQGSKEDILLAFGTPESVLGNASGRCLRATELVRLSNGERHMAKDLVGKRFKLLTATPAGQIEVDAWATQERIEPIYRVTTESGRTLETNARHPLFAATYETTRQAGWRSSNGPRVTVHGWTPVSTLEPSTSGPAWLVAVPTRVSQRGQNNLTVDEARVLGYLIGDGSISQVKGHVALTTPSGEMVDDFIHAVEALGDEVVQYRTGDRVATWGVRARSRKGAHGGRDTNRVRALLRRTGLLGTTSHDKFVPAEVFAASTRAQAEFLAALFACDGSLGIKKPNGAHIELGTVSARLASDVQELLLRVGVSSRVRRRTTQGGPGNRDKRGVGYAVVINAAVDVRRFCDSIDVVGKSGQAEAVFYQALNQLAAKSHGGNVHRWRTKHLDPDLRWERVTSVEHVGTDQTIGIAVPGHHTYLSTFYEHNTFDNADAEKENWWEEVEQPHCNAVGRGLDPLTGDVDDDEFVSFNWDEVDVLQRRKRARHDKKAEEVKAGLATIDDYFEATGRERWNVAGTRALILPNGMVIARDEADHSAIAQYPIVGQPAPADLTEHARAGALEGTHTGTRRFDNIVAARAMELARTHTRISRDAADRSTRRARS